MGTTFPDPYRDVSFIALHDIELLPGKAIIFCEYFVQTLNGIKLFKWRRRVERAE